jgi:hypothetical protein
MAIAYTVLHYAFVGKPSPHIGDMMSLVACLYCAADFLEI